MSPRKRFTQALDPDNSGPGVLTDEGPAPAAQADELAEAEARAATARARATQLREQAEAADRGDAADEEPPAPAPPRRRRLRLSRRRAVAVAASIVVSCAALTGSGYLMWHHHRVVQQSQRSAEFAAAARNGITKMMSIDASRARSDMQRFADETTGQFKVSLLMGAEERVKTLEQSKVVTTATVQAAAVQSMTQDSAVVLVVAKSELTKPDQPKPETRSWRLVVDVEREGGALKISKVEFVP